MMRQRPSRQQVIQTSSVPAPVGGLNARDSIAAMPPTDAIVMENWFPTPSGIDVRGGSVDWSTGLSGIVESLLVYNGLTGSKLFGCSGGSFYDCTSTGAVGAPLVTGFLNNRWQYTNFGTPAGQFLITVNGANSAYSYNGTAFQALAPDTSVLISTITHTGTLATVTTTTNHNLLTGNTVTISQAAESPYNGTYTITRTGATTFTYVMASTPTFNCGTPGSSIASITFSGTTATLTCSPAHGLISGIIVTVSGSSPAPYNGTFAINVLSATTFSYVMTSVPASNASGGTYKTATGQFIAATNITGISTAEFNYVTSFKGRLYFIQQNTLRVWYLPVSQIGGVATLFDMSSIFKLGGKLTAMQSWNIDTVQGPNDYLAFMSDKGEVVVYQGFDPSQSSTWNIVGSFRIGRPASGSRYVTKVGSDLYAISVDGLIPLSKAMLTDRSQGNFAVSAKIDNLVNNDVFLYANNFGWQVTLYPVGNKIIINVPFVENSIQYQYVCNTITGAWTKFTGWNASCFEIMGDNLYYGTSGKVVRADTGTTDNTSAIITDLKPAFSSFGVPGQNKQFTMARPIFSESGTVGISAILNVDFRDSLPTAVLTLPNQGNVSLWNVSPWNTSMWSVEGLVNINWQSVAGIGFQASYRMKTISRSAISLLAIDYGYQVGGIY